MDADINRVNRYHKKRKIKRLRRTEMVGMIVFAGLIVFGAVLLINNIRVYSEGNKLYKELREQVKVLELEKSIDLASVADEEEVGEEKTYDELSDDVLFINSLSSLGEVNSNFCAWIIQDGTCIDYPIVLGEDNEYYLNHLFDGEKNKLGCIFIDCRNEGDFSDRNTVVYGHNMKNGSMFHSITDYKDPEVYQTRPTMTIYTIDTAYTLELFAGIVVSGDYEFVEFNFDSEDDFMQYVNNLKADSTFESDVEVQPGDKLVTLCTCSYEYNNARYALVGRLVERIH